MGLVDAFDLLGNLLVVLLAEAYRILQPTIVSAARQMQVCAEPEYRVVLFFGQFLDRLVLIKMSS